MGLTKCLGSGGVGVPVEKSGLYPSFCKSKVDPNFMGGICYYSFKK